MQIFTKNVNDFNKNILYLNTKKIDTKENN